MKQRLFRLVSIFTISIGLSSGTVLPAGPHAQEVAKLTHVSKTRKVRLGLIGYLLIPDDYRAYQTADLRDAWYGYIASASADVLKIRYTAGLVQSPFQDGKEKFVWLKSESIYKGTLKYGLLKKENGGEFAASVGFVNFYASIDSEADTELFLKIVRPYRVEQCQDCERALLKPAIEQALGADSP